MLSRSSRFVSINLFSFRGVCSRNLALAVRFHENGPAEKVFKLETLDAAAANKQIAADEVSLKILAAPINPSDFYIAEGVYGVKPALPAFGGNEGVAEVVSTGANVRGLSKGDWVVPANAPFGTWRQVATAKASDIIKIPNDIPVAYASSLAINPTSAYRMLRDFQNLKPGDWIIQNGANGMVGMAVIQLARELGLKTINIVREDRPDVGKTLELLENLGGDINITDEYLGSAGSLEILKDLPPISLGLNCVGGESGVDLARVLAPGASLVTYGNMSKKALTVPEDLVASKQLQLKNFWIAEWFKNNSSEAQSAMLNELADLIKNKKLTFFFEMHDFDDFEYALSKAQEPFRFRKVVLNMDYPDRFAEHDARPDREYDVFETYAY
jgi:trans-2-enoyl-CoA reductase